MIVQSCHMILDLKADTDVSEEHVASVFRVGMFMARNRLGHVDR